jgi:predicted PurR-regulated permease PerM
VSDRAELFLGIIAVATLATAIAQVCVLVAAGLLARRILRLVDHIDQELKPIFEHVQSIARDASRAAAIATAQVERVDRAMTDFIQRLDRVLGIIQGFVAGPARNGTAWIATFRTVFNLIRDLRGGRARTRADDEDALFI